IADRYQQALQGIPGLQPPWIPTYARSNFQSYAIRLTAEFPLSRDVLMQQLLDRGISTRPGIMNAHQQPACRELGNFDLPVSEAVREQVLLLPLYEDLSADAQQHVIDALVSASKPLLLPLQS
ncbi:MAG: DegT/DnrJ/EryC1/StrS family aminotransferase, partial [Planctomycetales bacterium]|nr:DegT/DnrJ/EryC1/StrS family aminotransferase [Planctomycetales bacterium]